MANKTLYVGNISYSATEDTLTQAFAAYGASNVRIIDGRGFAFVDVNADQLDSAIADKNNQQLDGRTLTVNEARPRENRSSGGGNSYGGSSNGRSSGGSSYGGGKSRGSRW